MKLTEIIKKALKGEELNALEKAELERLDPDTLNQRAVDAENKLKEAQEKLDAAEQDKLSEAEKFKKRAEQAEAKLKASEDARRTAESDRDAVKQQHAALVRSNRIAELSAKHKCDDSEYLDFLANKRGIDINDDAKVTEFIESLKKEAPKYFAADVKPGAANPLPKPPEETPRQLDRIGSIIENLNNAPEIK